MRGRYLQRRFPAARSGSARRGRPAPGRRARGSARRGDSPRVRLDLATVKRSADRAGFGLRACVVLIDLLYEQTTTRTFELVSHLEVFLRLEDVFRILLGDQRGGHDRVDESPHARIIALLPAALWLVDLELETPGGVEVRMY